MKKGKHLVVSKELHKKLRDEAHERETTLQALVEEKLTNQGRVNVNKKP